MGAAFQAWVHERMPLSSQWLVLRIGCADLYSWVTDSIWLEHADCRVLDN